MRAIIWLFVLTLLACTTAFAGDDVPAWLRQVATVNVPTYDKEVTAVTLHDEARVTVDETGKVADISVIQAEPPGYFEEATLAHYRAQRFTPAMKDGKPRRFRARFLVEFGNPPPIAAAPEK